jgi:aminoglycoside phosphotransferase (APT) family kinase protein/SAM-dependent methyltransferase
MPGSRRHQLLRVLFFDQAGWRFLLPPGVLGRVVVLATPFDNTAAALAADGARVSVAGFNRDMLDVVGARLAESGRSDIEAILLDPGSPRLPGGDGACDAVVAFDADAVLAVVGVSPSARQPLFDALLREAHRVLRPGGALFVGLHSTVRSRLVGPHPAGAPRGASLRLRRVRSAAAAAGFITRDHPLIVSAGLIEEVIIDRYYSVKNSSSPRERLKELLLSGRWGRIFATGVAVVGQRPPVEAPMLEDALAAAEQDAEPPKHGRRVRRYQILSGKVILSIGTGPGRFGDRIAVLPLSSATVERRRREARMTQRLRAAGLAISALVPAQHPEGMLAGRPVFVLDEIPGISFDTNVGSLDSLTRRASEVLLRFHQDTTSAGLIDDVAFRALVAEPLRRSASQVGAHDATAQIARTLRERLMGRRLPTVWTHGDYKIENVLFDPSTHDVRGIIDWDLSESPGLPLLDLLYLLSYNRHIRERRPLDLIFVDTILPGRHGRLEQELVDGYVRALGVPDDLIDSLSVMFWIHHLAYRIHVDPRQPELAARCAAATEIAARRLRSPAGRASGDEG